MIWTSYDSKSSMIVIPELSWIYDFQVSKRNWGKQRTAFHAIKDFNSLSQAITQSVNLNIFKRNLFKFVI